MTVAVVNLIGAALATVCNVFGARRGVSASRPLWGAVAGLAGVYAIGYLWLALSQDLVNHDRVFLWVTAVSWPLVWCTAPLISARFQATLERRVDAAVADALAEARAQGEALRAQLAGVVPVPDDTEGAA